MRSSPTIHQLTRCDRRRLPCVRGAVASLLLVGSVLGACIGTTGSGIIQFDAYAAGPADLDATHTYTFTNSRGWTVTLSRAILHIGAVYLNQTRANSIERPTSCILPGTYVGAVRGSVDLDVLSPGLTPFAVSGEGIADTVLTGELWLVGDTDINANQDATVLLDVAGVAVQGTTEVPFAAQLTIGQNRAIAVTGPTLPGANPLCQQRIVSPIPTFFSTSNGGTLVVRVDPSGWFFNVDFSTLDAPSSPLQPAVFADETTAQPDINLYAWLRATQNVYSFQWTD